MTKKSKRGRPKKSAARPPSPHELMRVGWKLPRIWVQSVAVRAASKQMWVEDFVKQAVDHYMTQVDC